MATMATMPLPIREARPPEAGTPANALELQSAPQRPIGMAEIERHAEWPLLQRLPMRLTAAVPLPGFRVRDLLGLKAGSIVESAWHSADDVPLKVGAVQLSWSEFEVVEQRMAIRITRLA
jgi:flagellar motor switch protein FliN/FliY